MVPAISLFFKTIKGWAWVGADWPAQRQMGGIGDWGISVMGLGRCVLGKWRRGRDKEQEGCEASNSGISGQAAADDLCCVAAGSSRQ